MKKLIWAIDAFIPVDKTHQNAISVMTQLLKNTNGASILPVYTLSPDQLNIDTEFTKAWIQYYKPAAEKALQQVLKNFENISLIKKGHIILQKGLSTKSATLALANYAATQKADAIVANTHAREGISRFVLGSFTETLLFHSKVPVITISPSTHLDKEIKTILFPTDLSSNSHKTFCQLLKLAKNLNATVHLLHVIPHPIEPAIQSGTYLFSGGWIPVPNYLASQKEKRLKLTQRFMKSAQKENVKLVIKIEENSRSVTQSILDTLKQVNPQLLAMAAQSGKLSATLIGSITRNMIRHVDIPVWVYKQGKK